MHPERGIEPGITPLEEEVVQRGHTPAPTRRRPPLVRPATQATDERPVAGHVVRLTTQAPVSGPSNGRPVRWTTHPTGTSVVWCTRRSRPDDPGPTTRRRRPSPGDTACARSTGRRRPADR